MVVNLLLFLALGAVNPLLEQLVHSGGREAGHCAAKNHLRGDLGPVHPYRQRHTQHGDDDGNESVVRTSEVFEQIAHHQTQADDYRDDVAVQNFHGQFLLNYAFFENLPDPQFYD